MYFTVISIACTYLCIFFIIVLSWHCCEPQPVTFRHLIRVVQREK